MFWTIKLSEFSLTTYNIKLPVSIFQNIVFIHNKNHSKPTYMVDGVVHYGVANMPGAVPRTSTFALSNVIHSYALELANRGVADAVRSLSELAGGLNVAEGRVTNSAVAEAIGAKYTPPEQVF